MSIAPLSLPEGERLLWQGRPTVQGLAVRAFHIRVVALYFAVLFAVRVSMDVSNGHPFADALGGGSRVLLPAGIALGLLSALAVLYSRTTRYTLTSRRVLLQFGAVLPMTLNIPLAQVARADVRVHRDGSGEFPLTTVGGPRLSYLLLWPHVRPWRLNEVVPMLRCVPDADVLAKTLARSLSAADPPQREAEAATAPPAIASAA